MNLCIALSSIYTWLQRHKVHKTSWKFTMQSKMKVHKIKQAFLLKPTIGSSQVGPWKTMISRHSLRVAWSTAAVTVMIESESVLTKCSRKYHNAATQPAWQTFFPAITRLSFLLEDRDHCLSWFPVIFWIGLTLCHDLVRNNVASPRFLREQNCPNANLIQKKTCSHCHSQF